MISFTAKYIKPEYVEKISFDDGISRRTKVSCIELDPKNNADVDAVFEVANMWDASECYPEYIAIAIRHPAIEEDGRNKFYAITTQKDNFETPDPDKILALGQVFASDDTTEVEYLHVKPYKVNNYSEPFIYRKVGTSMLNLFKKLFFGKKILLYSRPTAIEFYLKNGFKVEDELDPARLSYMA